MKKRIEKILLRQISNSGVMVYPKQREIHFGLYGVCKYFLSATERLAIALLVKYFAYTCYEKKIKFY